jgi:hypothetical protein
VNAVFRQTAVSGNRKRQTMKLYNSLVDRLRTQHDVIEVIISNIDNDRTIIKPQPNKWSIKDNIAHLSKYQPIFIDRINKILKGTTPYFEPYVAENDIDFKNWQNQNIAVLMEKLITDRKVLFTLITELNDEELTLSGIHKKYGRLAVLQWTEFFLLHEAHHIFTIFKIANDTDLIIS